MQYLQLYVLVCSQLANVGNLYELIGDVIMDFVKKHTTTFPNASVSKKDFWSHDPWKRSMVFVFMTRYLYDMDGQKQWRKFSVKDYKFNVRLFNRWIKHETEIMVASPEYQNMPEKATNRKRSRIGRGRPVLKVPNSESATESPAKVRCVVNDDFTDDELPEPTKGIMIRNEDEDLDEPSLHSESGEEANDEDDDE